MRAASMRRLRLGLTGFASPTVRRYLGDVPADRLLHAYAQRFQCYEVTGTASPAWTAQASDNLLAMAPPHLRLLPRYPDQAAPDWGSQVAPILASPRCGPVYMPWHGPWTPRRHDELEARLERLWDVLPPGGTVSVEFHDPSWLRSDALGMLEMHEAGLVWSTRTGRVPYKLTAQHMHIRLTGHSPRSTGDEVAALLERLRARPVDDREIWVISARDHEAYGLHALERFARGMGHPWGTMPEAAQVALDDYAVTAY